jgi:hypothetical protein
VPKVLRDCARTFIEISSPRKLHAASKIDSGIGVGSDSEIGVGRPWLITSILVDSHIRENDDYAKYQVDSAFDVQAGQWDALRPVLIHVNNLPVHTESMGRGRVSVRVYFCHIPPLRPGIRCNWCHRTRRS